MPTILTTYFANTKNIEVDKPDALTVAITRYKPPVALDLWSQLLAPTKELLHAYKYDNLSWEKFVEKFKIQLYYDKRAMALLDTLAHISLYKDVCLVCFEKDPDQCHRSIVQEMIIERRLEIVDEFKMLYAMLHRRINHE